MSLRRPKRENLRGGSRTARPIVVRRAPGRPCEARVQLAHGTRRAALGRGGVKPIKREGDGGTPLGRLAVRFILYRADRGPRPRNSIPMRAIRQDDAWCEDPNSTNYNRLVRLPSGAGAAGGTDRLMRDDRLYDLVLVLGHNDHPRVKGRGSAIFAHLARDGYTPTAGCIALSRRDLLAVIAQVTRGSTFVVTR